MSQTLMQQIDPIMIALIPLLFMVLIFLTYLNVMESRRGRVIEEKLGKVADSLEKLAEKISKDHQ